MVARTIALVIIAAASLVYAGTQTVVERECITYRTDLAYSAEAGRYVVTDRPCILWGNLYARDVR